MKNRVFGGIALLFVCSVIALAKDDFTELQEYLPIAEKLYAGKTEEALQQAEQISDRNDFASVLLYLVYSRGYCGKQINYSKATRHFDNLIGGNGYQRRFHEWEFADVWRKMRVPPVDEQRNVVLKVWNDDGTGIIPQKINLKGKYPLKDCYSEKMRSLGGIAGYSIWVVVQMQFSELSEFAKEARKQSIRLGSIDALYAVIVPSDYRMQGQFWNSGEVDFGNLEKASLAGHLPAKIMLAAAQLVPVSEYRYAPDESRRLLKEAIKELEAYQATPCQHYKQDLETARYLLSLLPDKNASTENLLEECPDGSDARKVAAYRQEIAQRNDHPMCDIFRVLQLPEKEQSMAFWEIAEKGNQEAITILLRQNRNRPDGWRALYLAGKHRLPDQFNPTPEKSFFLQALVALNLQKFSMGMEKYRETLQMLAEVYPEAKQQYIRDFGALEDNTAERFRFESSDPERVKISRDGTFDENFHTLEVQQNNQQNYMDIFIQPGRFAFFCSPQPSPNVSMPSNLDFWIQMQYPDGTTRVASQWEQCEGKCPDRIRINVEPGKKTFVLKIHL